MNVIDYIQQAIDQIEEIYRIQPERLEDKLEEILKLNDILNRIVKLPIETFDLPTYQDIKQTMQMVRILQKEKKNDFK